MDKVLSRPIFKNTYLKTIKKPVSNFSKGGIAALGVKKYNIGGFNTVSQEDMDKLTAMTIAGSLLQGVRQPGQSQASALLSNLGTGVEKAIPVIMEGQKINAEGSSKLMSMFTTLEPVVDATTKETRFANKFEIMNSGGNLKPAASFPEQIARVAEASTQAKEITTKRVNSEESLLKAADTSAMAEKLKPIITNQSTFTGKAADWNLLAKNYGGSLAQLTGIDQIQRSDQSKDMNTADANYNDVLRYVNDNSSPDLTQAAKTLKAQIVYATARGLSNGQRLNLPEIKSAHDMLGESGDKDTYLTGINQTQQNLLTTAIRSYNFYHTDIKENQLQAAQSQIDNELKNNGKFSENTLNNPYAMVLLHNQKATNFLNQGLNTNNQSSIFNKSIPTSPVYGNKTQTPTQPTTQSNIQIPTQPTTQSNKNINNWSPSAIGINFQNQPNS